MFGLNRCMCFSMFAFSMRCLELRRLHFFNLQWSMPTAGRCRAATEASSPVPQTAKPTTARVAPLSPRPPAPQPAAPPAFERLGLG